MSITEILKPIVVSINETYQQVFFLKVLVWNFFVKAAVTEVSEIKIVHSIQTLQSALKFIITIVQSETAIVQSMQIVQSAAGTNGEFVSK